MSQDFHYVERLVGPVCVFCMNAIAGPAITQGAYNQMCIPCAEAIAEALPKEEEEAPRRRGRPAGRRNHGE